MASQVFYRWMVVIELRHVHPISIRQVACYDSSWWYRITGDVGNPEDGTALLDPQTLAWVTLVFTKGRISCTSITIWEHSEKIAPEIITVFLHTANHTPGVISIYHAVIGSVPWTVWNPFIALLVWPLCENHKLHERIALGFWTKWRQTCTYSPSGVIVVSHTSCWVETRRSAVMEWRELFNIALSRTVPSVVILK